MVSTWSERDIPHAEDFGWPLKKPKKRTDNSVENEFAEGEFAMAA